MTHRRVLLTAGLSVALAAGACTNDVLFSPAVPSYAGGAMFQRYVSMGNSITAGFQSAGINDSTQKQSYVALVAGAMGAAYYYPSLTMPGCPPPLTNIFLQARVGGAGSTSTTCLLRSANIPPFLTNVAVPGAEVLDAVLNGPAPGTNSNALTQLMLGGRTQTQAMQAAHPTFVSVWLGNNDLLGAAELGDTTFATDTGRFRREYAQVLDSIQATGASAVLIAVGLGHLANGVVPPFFSRGTTWYSYWFNGAFNPAPFTVAANCAPPRGDTVLVSFAYGFTLLAQAQRGSPTTLDCTIPPVDQPPQVRFFVRLQLEYNAIIQSLAAAHSWAYTDGIDSTLDSLATDLGQIRPFPNIGNPPPGCATNTFGAAFSCDGIHPSAATQRLIARKIVQAINQKYGSAIPAVP